MMATPVAIRIRMRSRLIILMASFLGFVAFFWPFVIAPGTFGDTAMPPLMFGALLLLVVAIVFAEIADGGIDSKAIAMLGVKPRRMRSIRPRQAASRALRAT